MMKILFLVLFFSPPISWRELSWDDFKGAPTNSHAASAVTELVVQNGQASAYFYTSLSWTRSNSDYILRHEQCHFDITEIYARSYHKGMDADSLLAAWNREEDRYDYETAHGTNDSKQLKWEAKVNNELRVKEQPTN